MYWLEPVNGYAIGSSLAVRVNNVSVGNITASTPYQGIQFLNQYVVGLMVGLNTISFQMFGTNPSGVGYYLTNVTLQKLIAIPQPEPETETEPEPSASFYLRIDSPIF